LADSLLLERVHFGHPAKMVFSTGEPGGEKGSDQFKSKRRAYNPPTQAGDIHIVVLNALMRGEYVVNESGPSAGNLVRCNRRPNTAAAQCYASLDFSLRHG